MPVGETEDWRARWRLAELADARDAWLCLFGRSGALARHVSRDGPLPAPGTVLVGAHWGTGLRALIVFRRAGLAPRFVYRRVDTSLRRAAPFQYLYLKVLVHCIRRVCAGRSIEVPGARRAFEAALGEAGSLVVLLDAPARNRADAIAAQVVGRAAEFNRNGARLLAENGARCVFYALAEQLRGEAELSCSAPFVPDSAESLVHDYGRFLTGLLEQDAAQWRLWHAAPQVFRESG
jgi:hypothetical protein